MLQLDYTREGSIISTGFSDKDREEYSGWLGDTALTDNDEQITSLGNDDYKSDLDSENITYIMKSENKSYTQAQNEYYESIKNGSYTRAEKFLEHTKLSYIKDKIMYELYTGRGIENATYEDLKNDYPDTYNFLNSLVQNSNDLIK